VEYSNKNSKYLDASETQSVDISDYSTSGTQVMSIKNEINETTRNIEELWQKLASIWPVVKDHPDIVTKLEKLWFDLKSTVDDEMPETEQPENLIEQLQNKYSDLMEETDKPRQTAEFKYSTYTVSGTEPTTEEIDKLLADILGEGYLATLESPEIYDPAAENKTAIPGIDTNYITGSKELDDMVTSVLGEGWEKEDEYEHSSSIDLNTSKPAKDIESVENDNQNLTQNPEELNQLVRSIITDEIPVQPEDNKLLDDEDNVSNNNNVLEYSGETNNVHRTLNTNQTVNNDKAVFNKEFKTSNKPAKPGQSTDGNNKIPNKKTLRQEINSSNYDNTQLNQTNKKSPLSKVSAIILVMLSGYILVSFFTGIDNSKINKSYTNKSSENSAKMKLKRQPGSNYGFINTLPITTYSKPTSRAQLSPLIDEARDSRPLSNTSAIDNYDDEYYYARVDQTDNDITIFIDEPDQTIAPIHQTGSNNTESKINPIKPDTDTSRSNIQTPRESINKNKTIITYTVVSGDTLWGITKRFIKNPYKYPELAKLSNIKNPNIIYPGNKIIIVKQSNKNK